MTDKRFAFIKDQAHSLLHKAHITNFPVDLSQVANHIPQLTLLPFSQGKKALSLSEETLVSLQQQSPVVVLGNCRNQKTYYTILYFPATFPPLNQSIRYTIARLMGHILLQHSRENTHAFLEASTFARFLLCPQPLLAPAKDRYSFHRLWVQCQVPKDLLFLALQEG